MHAPRGTHDGFKTLALLTASIPRESHFLGNRSSVERTRQDNDHSTYLCEAKDATTEVCKPQLCGKCATLKPWAKWAEKSH